MKLVATLRTALKVPKLLASAAGDLVSLQPARVNGISMKPTLLPGDLIAVRRLHPDEPQIGQVVLANVGFLDVVKRVVDVDEDQVTLEGDNRRASTDPGAVPREAVTGIVMARYWPLRW